MDGRQAEVAQLLRATGSALDDDEIAARLGMNRHYVNQICRRLAAQNVIRRMQGSGGKLVNEAIEPGVSGDPEAVRVVVQPRTQIRRQDRARANVEALVTDFATYVGRFESRNRFGGPSRYFHDRAIERRRQHDSVDTLLQDERFLEYVYAVLPAWGMHRMGEQAAKVGEFDDMVGSLRATLPILRRLWPVEIGHLQADRVSTTTQDVWAVIGSLRVSTSETRIVAGSKALHHILPDLVPPIDRQYTFRFFTGQKAVTGGDERAFGEWFPYFVEIAGRSRAPIADALARRGFMATSVTKVIDNAIIGFMQSRSPSS